MEQLTHPLKVSKIAKETNDAVSIAFEIPENLKKIFTYRAGQFVTLALKIEGQEVNRSYSLCTSPLTETEFKIAVKKVRGGMASTFLCEKLKVGEILRVTPPAGQFFRPTLEAAHYVLFGAGSGITPLISILKTVLSSNPQNSITLVYSNRNEGSIIFKDEIESLREKHSSRLEVHHLLSQPTSNVRPTRCTPDWVKSFVTSKNLQKAEFYLCGPDEFMASISETLLQAKISKEQIHQESFAIGLTKKTSVEFKKDWTYVGDKNAAEEIAGGHLKAIIQGEEVECEVKKDQSILEALIEAGANPPYSCMDGACMACLAKVKEGLVYQSDLGILSEENVENRETLTCQARVLSRTVKVSYDEI